MDIIYPKHMCRFDLVFPLGKNSSFVVLIILFP